MHVAGFFFKQKTAYELRISDWSSDVCSSDLIADQHHRHIGGAREAHVRDVAFAQIDLGGRSRALDDDDVALAAQPMIAFEHFGHQRPARFAEIAAAQCAAHARSEERRVGKECVSTCRSRWPTYH